MARIAASAPAVPGTLLALGIGLVAIGLSVWPNEPSVQWKPIEVPVSVLDSASQAEVADLVELNREAAARVALIGLVSPEKRRDTAHQTIAWMERASTSLLTDANPYAARQRILLDDWRQALGSYLEGQPGGLHRIREVSAANAALCAEMTEQIPLHSTAVRNTIEP